MTRTLTALLAALLTAATLSTANAFGFPDVPTTHPHHEAVEWATWEGYAHGFPDGTFRPDEPITRGQMAAMLQRYHHGQEGGEGRRQWRQQETPGH